jgi:DNA-binding XRE family transcriptional regulator
MVRRGKRDQSARKRGVHVRVKSGAGASHILSRGYLQLRELARLLKEAREKANWSLNDLAEKTGLDRGSIWKIEAGHQENPTWETLLKLSQALGFRLRFVLESKR